MARSTLRAMRIANQAIPPEYAQLLALIQSKNRNAHGGSAIARTRRRARRPISARQVRDQLFHIIDACHTLADRLDYPADSRARREFIYAQTQAILRGELLEPYWISQPLATSAILTSTATSVDDLSPPPYAYRVEWNLPTRPTYPPGALGSGPPSYAGSTAAGRFADERTTWSREIYTLGSPLEDRDTEPTFLQLASTIVIDTDARGSRPMCSILIQRTFAPAGTLIADTPAWPFRNALSMYWRYRVPFGVAPYYHVAHDRAILIRLYPIKAQLAHVPLGEIAISIAPRPMLGRGFNNNTSVQTSLTNTTRIVQINPRVRDRGPYTIKEYRYAYDVNQTPIATTRRVPTGALLYPWLRDQTVNSPWPAQGRLPGYPIGPEIIDTVPNGYRKRQGWQVTSPQWYGYYQTVVAFQGDDPFPQP